MAEKLGLDGKIYRNTATFASPTWNECLNVKDPTLNLEYAEADATTRKNGGWEAVVAALRKGSVEFQMVWDPADEDFTAILTAFLARTKLEFLILDGGSAVTGSQGLRALMTILTFSRGESSEETMMAAVTLKPTYSDNAPSWFTAA